MIVWRLWLIYTSCMLHALAAWNHVNSTQLNSTSSWVELRRYKRPFRHSMASVKCEPIDREVGSIKGRRGSTIIWWRQDTNKTEKVLPNHKGKKTEMLWACFTYGRRQITKTRCIDYYEKQHLTKIKLGSQKKNRIDATRQDLKNSVTWEDYGKPFSHLFHICRYLQIFANISN